VSQSKRGGRKISKVDAGEDTDPFEIHCSPRPVPKAGLLPACSSERDTLAKAQLYLLFTGGFSLMVL
jgi:hypothetical protein